MKAEPENYSGRTRSAMKRAVDEQLAQKALTRVEKNADLCVAYQAAIDKSPNFVERVVILLERLRRPVYRLLRSELHL